MPGAHKFFQQRTLTNVYVLQTILFYQTIAYQLHLIGRWRLYGNITHTNSIIRTLQIIEGGFYQFHFLFLA